MKEEKKLYRVTWTSNFIFTSQLSRLVIAPTPIQALGKLDDREMANFVSLEYIEDVQE